GTVSLRTSRSPISIPVVETERLRLRGHRKDDLAACVAMWTDPIVTRYISGRASTEQQTWSRLLTYIGHWDLLGFGYWAIEEKSTGDFVGEVGLADFKRDIAPSMKGSPELGFALIPSVHGKGYATEAVRGALSWADANIAQRRSVCLVNPQNVASRHVAEKCGYEVFEENLYNGQGVLFLARNADRKAAPPPV
ncbi:MAG TPA: GNAT family N-acetyltransferase, partial [Candidatus Cybelea sp.]